MRVFNGGIEGNIISTVSTILTCMNMIIKPRKIQIIL